MTARPTKHAPAPAAASLARASDGAPREHLSSAPEPAACGVSCDDSLVGVAGSGSISLRVYEARMEHPELTYRQLGEMLGMTVSQVSQAIFRARRKLGVPTIKRSIKTGMPTDRRMRIETVATICREIGEAGFARMIEVKIGRALELMAGSEPTDDEQIEIDRAYAVARVRLLEIVPGHFARFDALARIESRRALVVLVEGTPA